MPWTQGYVMRRQNGDLYRNPAFWFHDALIPDFTQEQAAAWWLKKRAYLVEQFGVAGFKTDGGEHLQGHDVVAADGRRGSELANAYPNLYVGAYHRFAQQLRARRCRDLQPCRLYRRRRISRPLGRRRKLHVGGLPPLAPCRPLLRPERRAVLGLGHRRL